MMQLEKKFTKEEFVELYNKNSVTDLAKKLGFTRQTIILMARKYGLPHKKIGGGEIRKKYKTAKVNIKELESLYRTMKTVDLAKKFNISATTLVKILKEHGVEMKKPGGQGIRERKLIVEG